MANNAVLQRGFELPDKKYYEINLDIPDSNWISIFIMTSLWTLGTIIISNISNIIFPQFKTNTHKTILFIEILTQLLLVSLLLYLYQNFIFYPIISFIHNNKLHHFNYDSIITATTVGVSLGLNIQPLFNKLHSFTQY